MRSSVGIRVAQIIIETYITIEEFGKNSFLRAKDESDRREMSKTIRLYRVAISTTIYTF